MSRPKIKGMAMDKMGHVISAYFVAHNSPLLHSVVQKQHLAKVSILEKDRRDHGKKFYELCVYESVGDGSLSWVTSKKNDRKQNSCSKGLMYHRYLMLYYCDTKFNSIVIIIMRG